MGKKKKITCPICKKNYVALEGLYLHIEDVHREQIPDYMESGAQYYCFLRTGKTEGKCVICGNPTNWNYITNKYYRICKNPKCKEEIRKQYVKNMMAKYGKITLMDDPEYQKRKLLANRKISGQYQFKDKSRIQYVGSYEKNFLQFLDLFLNWDPNDIISPSPQTFVYEYENNSHFYIPDLYIISLDLNIEIKDGGKNPNMHHKIQDVDKVKERLKDNVMLTQKSSYVKIYDNDFSNFIRFLNKRKENYIDNKDLDKPIFIIEDLNARVSLESSYPSTLITSLMDYSNSFKGPYRWNHKKRISYIAGQLDKAKTRDELLIINKIVESDARSCKIILADKNNDNYYEANLYYKFIKGEYKYLFKHYMMEASKSNIKSRTTFKSLKEVAMENIKIYTDDNTSEINIETCPTGFYFKNEEGELFWNSIKWIDGKPYRETVETLVFKIEDNEVFLYCRKKDERYDSALNLSNYIFPGGSIENNVDNIKQAENEVNEEALIDIKDIIDHNLTYMRPAGKKKITKRGDFDYAGKFVHLYSAMYVGEFKGHVEDKDRDESFVKYGKFHKVKDIYNDLITPHKKVIDERIQF